VCQIDCNAPAHIQLWTMTMILQFLLEEGGASAAEYALILAVVGSAIVVAVFLLGGAIANSINRASNCFSNVTSSGC